MDQPARSPMPPPDTPPPPPPLPTDAPRRSRTRRVLRWVTIVIGVVFFLFLIREVLFPFNEEGYVEISHGDHVHYVPRDRNPDVSISNFPTQPPGPDERITPNGRVVPK